MQNGDSAVVPFAIIEMGVLVPNCLGVPSVFGLVSAEDRKVGIVHHRSVAAERVKVGFGAFDHRGDSVGTIISPTECEKVAPRKPGARPLVGRMLGFVHRVVVQHSGDDGAQVVDLFAFGEGSNRDQYAFDMANLVVAALPLAIANNEPIEEVAPGAEVFGPGELDRCRRPVSRVSCRVAVGVIVCGHPCSLAACLP